MHHRSKTEDVLALDSKQQWERDRQIILAQLHNLMLALRSNTKFSSRVRFVQAAMEPQHRLMTLVKDLREALFSPQMDIIPEKIILQPFCEVALSEETTEPITGVALAAFVTFLDLKCSFLTEESLVRLSDCASNSRSEIADAQSHEAVLARILQVYVGCSRHPNARCLSEHHIVGMLERAYAVSTHGDPSELLRRTAEQAMNDIVTAVFYRIVEDCHRHEDDASCSDAATPMKVYCDGTLIMQYICKLIMCDVALPQVPPGQSAVSVAAVQLQGLCLAHTALFILKDSLRLPRCLGLLRFVRNDLSRALLTIGTRSENIIVLSQLLRTAHLVVQFASIAVVPQALSIVKGIHLIPMMSTLGIADGPMSPTSFASSANGKGFRASNFGIVGPDDIETRETHEMLIESLLEFCSDHSFATFCFVHYDLSLHYPPLLEQLAYFLARNCFHLPNSTAAQQQTIANGTAPSSSLPSTPLSTGGASPSPAAASGTPLSNNSSNTLHLNQINILSFDSLMALLMAVYERVVSHQQEESTPAELMATVRAAVVEKLKEKQRIMTFAEKFAQDPLKEGIRFLLDPPEAHLNTTGWEVGEFLFEHKSILDKNVLGEYLGDLGKEPVKPDAADTAAVAKWEADRVDDHKKPGTLRFFDRQLKGFLNGFRFHGKELLQSIREMVFQMRLPGEAQKIDRVMQAFAEHWYACNRTSSHDINPFQSEDAAFILSFSIIMLNTDLHSGKMDKTMTQEQFRSMNRGIDNGQNIPDTYLNGVYDSVKREQIIMIDMVRQGHEYDAVWKMEMAEAREIAHNSLLSVSMRGNSAPDLFPFDEFVFSTLWKPCMVGFSTVMEVCGNTFSSLTPMDRHVQTKDLMIASLKKSAPKDLAVFQCALNGLRMITVSAEFFKTPEAADQAVLCLLGRIPLSLQSGFSNLQVLGRTAAVVFYLDELFYLLRTFGSQIRDAWTDIATFLHQCFLLGLFADKWGLPHEGELDAELHKSPSRQHSETHSDSGLSLRENSEIGNDDGASLDVISNVLLSNPGIISAQSARLQYQQQQAEQGGWLSGIFGSSNTHEGKRKEKEIEDLAALRRVKSSVPDIRFIIEHSTRISDEAFVMMVGGLCRSGCTSLISAADGFSASYAIHFTLEVALSNLRRIELVDEVLFKYIHDQLLGAFTQLEQAQLAAVNSTSGSSQGTTPNPNATKNAIASQEHWRSVASRMTDAALRLVAGLARAPKHHSVMLRLLLAMTELPQGGFAAVVAQPLSITLYKVIVDRNPVDGEVFQTSSNAWNHLLYTAHTVGVLAPFIEVRSRILAVLLTIAKQGTYDLLENSQRLGHALTSIVLAPAVTASEIPQDWMSITSFDNTPYVSLQTPLKTTKEIPLKDQEEKVPEALTIIYKRLVVLCRESAPWEGDSGGKWMQSWLFMLSGLLTFVVSARQQRISSDSLLCLQRCIVDTDLLCLPLPLVMELFNQVVFPLTEKLCAPLLPSTSAAGTNSDGTPSNSPQRTGRLGVNGLSLLSPSVLISTVFGPLAGPESSQGASSTAGAPTCSLVPVNAAHTTDDMQCRALSLLPKTFLHFIYIIASSNGGHVLSQAPTASPQPSFGNLEDLWKRMMGTLYALYSHGSSHNGSHAKHKDSDSGVLHEAIQENVKNLIFVLTATVSETEHKNLLHLYPGFWTLTKDLVKVFDFGAHLVEHINTFPFGSN